MCRGSRPRPGVIRRVVQEGAFSIHRFRSVRTPDVLAVLLVAFASLVGVDAAVAASDASIRATSSGSGVTTRGVKGVDPGAKPAPPPEVKAPEAPAESEPEPAKAKKVRKFRVKKIRFEGNRIFGAEELGPLAATVEGKEISLADLKQLTRKIRELYQSRGYVLARAVIPPQKTKSGEVRIVISEGRYGQLKVQGNKYYSDRFVRRFFRSAYREGTVRAAPVHRSLLLLNEYTDLTVKSLFVAGKEKGTADVILQVKDRNPVHLTLDYNNYGTVFAGRHRFGVGISRANNVFDGDEFFVRTTKPHPTEGDPFWQGGYSVPVNGRGDKVALSYANSAVLLGGDLQVLDIRGSAEVIGITYQHPQVRKIAESQNWMAGLVGKTVKNFLFGDQQASQDDLRILQLGVDGNILRGKGRTLYSAVCFQGLGDLFGGVRSGAKWPDGTNRSSRIGSGNDFTRSNVDIYHIRSLNKKSFMLFHGAGQIASDPLPVSEQFALGGPDSVRGYIQSEFLGDEGYTLSAEFRRSIFDSTQNHVQAAAFFDHGKATLRKPLTGEIPNKEFNGVGIGARASLFNHLTLRLDVAWPLEGDNMDGTSPVLYAQASSRW